MQLKNKQAVVTGGASGIGLAITRALHAQGARVLAIGRDRAKLDAVHDEASGITTLVADVSDVDERRRVIDYLTGSGTSVDIFVNNAGTMQYFALTDADALVRLDAELALDLHAPIHFSTALLPHLLARAEAAIVNLTTGLVYAPYGGTPGYSAAKNGLHAFNQSLRRQTRDSGLLVLDVLPPTVDSDLTKGYEGPKAKPETVADAIVAALTAGQSGDVRVGQSKALYAMSRIAPAFLSRMLNNAIDKGTRDPRA